MGGKISGKKGGAFLQTGRAEGSQKKAKKLRGKTGGQELKEWSGQKTQAGFRQKPRGEYIAAVGLGD